MNDSKLYICGKITGLENLNVEKFEHYEEIYKKKGYIVINPHKIKENWLEKEWEYYMHNDIKTLIECDIIAVLDDWSDSKGARLEILIAQQLGKTIIYAETEEKFDYELTINGEYLNTVNEEGSKNRIKESI